MNAADLRARQRFIKGLRDFADWLEKDDTIPVPGGALITARLADPEAVRQFATVHRLRTGAADRCIYAAAVFGPITVCMRAPAVKVVTL